jgi:serine phosphatase RsbU (regulator of sigma subunit)
VSRDGTLSFANAGHLAPYRDGEELACENSLPLGLVAEAVYCESTLQLSVGEQVTLVTDGVVEARSKSGELFGFARTAAISAQSAESIATQAQEFGQDDDITVLTVTRMAATVSSTV